MYPALFAVTEVEAIEHDAVLEVQYYDKATGSVGFDSPGYDSVRLDCESILSLATDLTEFYGEVCADSTASTGLYAVERRLRPGAIEDYASRLVAANKELAYLKELIERWCPDVLRARIVEDLRAKGYKL